MDRTGDFVKIALLFDSGAPRATPQHRPLSVDARRAQQIADALRQQELGLRELQALVARKAILGDDPGARIAALTDALKRELGAAESGIQHFHEAVVTPRGRTQQHHQAHFAVVCSSLKARCAKSVKLFHQALQQHTAAIKERSSRRSKFSHGGASPVVHLNAPLFARTAGGSQGAPAQQRAGDPALQPLLAGGSEPPRNGALASSANPLAGNPEPPVPGVGLRRRAGNLGASPFMQQQPTVPGNGGGVNGGQQAMQYHARQDAQTRYQNAVQVESTIVEITGMYTRMATMVAEQGEILERIDDHMDIAAENVRDAESELLKYYNMVQGNRSLILKIFAILLLMIFLFVVVF
ncbi:hypothetical protein PybrP1_013115 [[Pythium] brassicae (nom. inval.)]|nr:hypothetical protein PybrP1_013115 [[Pythium] brassicae (nom. inval.)]